MQKKGGAMLKLCHHKLTNRGYVTYERKRHYVPGRWPSDLKKAPAVIEEGYRLLVRKLLGDQTAKDVAEQMALPGDLTIAELCKLYLKSCQKNEDHRTFSVMKSVVKPLVRFSTHLPAKDFGPLKLQEFRNRLIKTGYDRIKPSTGKVTHHEYTRSGINYFAKRVKKIFRWAVTQELYPAEQLHALQAVLPLRKGRTAAPEAKEITQVTDVIINQTLPHLPPPIAAMVKIQRLSGMRPGEVCRLSMPEIDRTDPECWIYIPAEHKTAHLNKHRVVAFVSEAQRVLEPWLREDDKPLFSPQEWMSERKRIMRENRKSKVQPSQVDRSKANPSRRPGDAYTTFSYGKVIAQACKAHNIPCWCPNQLRKRAAQRVLETAGLDVTDAAALLGNDPAVARRFYLQAAKAKAKTVALAVEQGATAKNEPPLQ